MVFEVDRFRALTFDCYGTLIDWDTGIRAALKPIKALERSDHERLLRDREAAEHALLAGPFRLYGGILGDSLREAAQAQGVKLHYGDILGFVNSMNRWPPFPDAGTALRRLAVSHSLGILSNVETKVLEASVRHLGAPFLARITAEDIHSYKPAPRHWEKALERLHQPMECVLHVAGSLVHDIRPARALGFACAWINRRKEPVPEDLDPTWVFPDLTALVNTLLGPAQPVQR
jgi:2-haloalkanoic acid dehalogenase type II